MKDVAAIAGLLLGVVLGCSHPKPLETEKPLERAVSASPARGTSAAEKPAEEAAAASSASESGAPLLGYTSDYAFSSNGETMLLLHRTEDRAHDGIWLYRKGRPLERLSDARGASLWVSPDGSTVAFTGDTDVRVFDSESAKQVLRVDAGGFGGCEDYCSMSSLLVSPDRGRVFGIHDDSGVAYLWTRGEERPYFEEYLLAMSQDGESCIAARREGQNVVYSVRPCTKKAPAVTLDRASNLVEAKWHFPGRGQRVYVESGSEEGRVLRVYDVRNGRLSWQTLAHLSAVEDDGSVWTLSGEGIRRHDEQGKPVQSMKQSTGKLLGSGALIVRSDEVRLVPEFCPWPQLRWNRTSGEPLPALEAPPGTVDCSRR